MMIMTAGLVAALVTLSCSCSAACLVLRRHHPRGRGGQAQRGHHELRLERPLQPLERPDRRHVPLAVLLRLRPVPGAALPHRKVDRAEPPEPAVQRRGQDPDAVLHPLHRGDGVRLLHLREAADLFQKTELERMQAPAMRAEYGAVAERYDAAFERRRAGGPVDRGAARR